MSVEFYYVGKDGQPHGPIPLEDLRKLRQSGVLTEATLVCPVGSEAWNPYAEDPVINGQQTAPTPAAAPAVPSASAKPASSSKILLGVGIGCLGVLVLAGGGCAALFVGILGMLNDEPRKQEVADAAAALLVQRHPEEAKAIGLPLKPGYMWSGNINWGSTTTFDGSMPVDGTVTSGYLSFDAEKAPGGRWVFKHAILRFDGKSIDLVGPGVIQSILKSKAAQEGAAPASEDVTGDSTGPSAPASP